MEHAQHEVHAGFGVLGADGGHVGVDDEDVAGVDDVAQRDVAGVVEEAPQRRDAGEQADLVAGRVEPLGGGTARWTIKGPMGREVHLVNSITESIENETISWQSEPESEIANSGEVRFADAPAGRGTYVTLILAYDPPAGKLGRLGAKLLQREPEAPQKAANDNPKPGDR